MMATAPSAKTKGAEKEREMDKCNRGTESAVPFDVGLVAFPLMDATQPATNFLIWPEKNRPQIT